MAFFFTLSLFLALQSQSSILTAKEQSPKDKRIEEIDQRIQELKLVKRGYEAKAIRHENLGEIRQFQDKYSLEARRHFQLAEQNRHMVEMIQKDIDKLEKEKHSLQLAFVFFDPIAKLS